MSVVFEITNVKFVDLDSNDAEYKKLSNCMKCVISGRVTGLNVADASAYYHTGFAYSYALVSPNNKQEFIWEPDEKNSYHFTCTQYPTQNLPDCILYIYQGTAPSGWDFNKNKLCCIPAGCQSFSICQLNTPDTIYGTIGSCCCQRWVAITGKCTSTCWPTPCICQPVTIKPTDPTPVKPVIDPIAPPPIDLFGDDDYPTPILGVDPTIKVSNCTFECLGMYTETPAADSGYARIKCSKLVLRGKCTLPNTAAAGSTFTYTYHVLNGATRKDVIFQCQKLFPAKTCTVSTYPTHVLPDYEIYFTLQPLPDDWDHAKFPCCYLSTGSIDFAMSVVSGTTKIIRCTASNTTGAVYCQRISK
jgi:hypothetical protein